jgi:pimeloyl-ACP methyl ester carboxylesterase
MAPTIVPVHGAFAESSSWDRVIDPLLSACHRVIAAPNPLRRLAADAASVGDVVRSVQGPPAELQRFMAERARARRTVGIPGASHALAVSRPDATADLILEAAAPLRAAA